jgi:hypothetical protein
MLQAFEGICYLDTNFTSLFSFLGLASHSLEGNLARGDFGVTVGVVDGRNWVASYQAST